jgi:pimeloyl-ACP methyl ester carboxylesterase
VFGFWRLGGAAIVVVGLLAGAPVGAAASGALLQPCTDGAPSGALCGSIVVPLDRAHPGAGVISVGFEVYPHLMASASRLGTIVAVQGGPGVSTTATRDQFLQSFGPLLARRDLVLIDARGTGISGAIDCPALQRELAAPDSAAPQAVAACAAQLSTTAYDYGSAAIADDIDAVRAALGRKRIDLYGPSYAGVFATSYALRHPRHLRSLVLDSPFALGDDTWFTSTARAEVRSVNLICRRSPSCRAHNSAPGKTLAALAVRLRRHPLEGTGYADGRPQHVRLDEAGLALLLQSEDAGFLNQGEIVAAGRALLSGDATPLLRIAAENQQPLPVDDPSFNSAGAQAATFCSDGAFAWSKNASPATRRQQYHQARARLDRRRFAPFSVAGWTRSHPGPGLGSPFCLDWAQHNAPPSPVPPGAVFPAVPTLVLASDIELLPEENGRALAARFPRAHFVEVANTSHVTAANNACADTLMLRFIDTLKPGNTRCAHQFTPRYAVGAFPRLARDASPARAAPGGTNQAGPAARRIVAVAWQAAYDAIQHSFRQTQPIGRGLRGGRFTATFSNTAETTTYRETRYTHDVAITGTIKWAFATGRATGQLQVRAGLKPAGTLQITGPLFPHTGHISITGTIHGQHVDVTVPTA